MHFTTNLPANWKFITLFSIANFLNPKGFPNVLGFSAPSEVGSHTKTKHLLNSCNEADPLLSPTLGKPIGMTSTPPVSGQRNLPVGVADFFRSSSVELKAEGTGGGGNGAGSNINLLSSRHLIISPIIPKEKFVLF